MLITGFLNGLGVAAKAAVGVSLAAAGVTAGAAAGALPGPAQTAIANSVEAATPFSFPSGKEARSDVGGTLRPGAADGGVDRRTKRVDAGLKGVVNGPVDVGHPIVPGQNGLDQAYLNPALGRPPTSLPYVAPSGAGTPRSTGIDAAGAPDAAGLRPVVPLGAAAAAAGGGAVGTARPGSSSTEATLTGEATASLAVVAAASAAGTASVQLQGASGSVLASADVKLAANASVAFAYSLKGKPGTAARVSTKLRADGCVALTVTATGAVSGTVEATVLSSGTSTVVRAAVSTTGSGDVANAVVCAEAKASVRT